MLVGLLFVACTVFTGPSGMGETCERTNQCLDDGVCLAGVCGGYACASDIDCDNGLTCEDIDGVAACAQTCERDADCAGAQVCREDGVCL